MFSDVVVESTGTPNGVFVSENSANLSTVYKGTKPCENDLESAIFNYYLQK
jgi:hypothetical protein